MNTMPRDYHKMQKSTRQVLESIGVLMCAHHTHALTFKTHRASSQFSQWLSNTERWQLDSSKDSLGLAQFINKDAAVYEYVHLISSEWQKFSGGDPKAVSPETQSQLFVEQFPTALMHNAT